MVCFGLSLVIYRDLQRYFVTLYSSNQLLLLLKGHVTILKDRSWLETNVANRIYLSKQLKPDNLLKKLKCSQLKKY